ncbi:MAG: hypothetical protein MR881_05165 [Bacteroidales bacterium]|nr:hypothetical protein [Bacteroidales bacterium]
MTQKKLYTAPKAAVFNLYAEQSMLLSASKSVTIGDDEDETTTAPMTNKKGFYDDNIWSNMRDGSEYDMQ